VCVCVRMFLYVGVRECRCTLVVCMDVHVCVPYPSEKGPMGGART
jgi:hypothetical protein